MGKGNLFYRTLLYVIVLLCSFEAKASPFFSQWIGVLHHETLKRDQLVKLDFSLSRGQENELELLAMFTLHFGDFKSGEYITYHFDKVRHNLLSGKFVFEQADQPVGLTVTKYNSEELVVEVRSLTGFVGRAILRREGTAETKFPMIQPIGGKYDGFCGGEPTFLQLYTFRSSKDLVRAAHPFAAYEVKGNLGQARRDCPRCKTEIRDYFSSADYDFFSAQLTLSGNSENLSCTVDDEGLNSCKYGDKVCSFDRKGSVSTGTFKPVVYDSAFHDLTPEASLSSPLSARLGSGLYRGYVHHEYLNIYQRADLHLSVLPSTPGIGTRLSAAATVYFGDEKSGERINYKYTDQPYINPIAVAPVIVLKQTEDDVDAVIQIESISENTIRGVWYSIIFGRVGRFELQKNNIPVELPSGANVMKSISGLYKASKIEGVAPQYEMHLLASRGEAPLISENPFSPNFFRGSIRNPQVEGRPKAAILNGSYDFYTGRIGFTRRFDFYGVAGSFEGNFVGERRADSVMRLSFISPLILNSLPPFELPQSFAATTGD